MTQRSEIRDGMRIDWDQPITMDDGLIVRADIFRPIAEGKYPVILTYGPYAKGLAFQDGYPSAWQRMVEKHPDVAAGSSNLYQSWEVVDPEKWVPAGYALRARQLARRGLLARLHRSLFTARDEGLLRLHRMGRPSSRGRTARSGSTAFGTTASMPGTSPRCSPRISRRCAYGKARPTGTAT